jgi:hypothetical protein
VVVAVAGKITINRKIRAIVKNVGFYLLNPISWQSRYKCATTTTCHHGTVADDGLNPPEIGGGLPELRKLNGKQSTFKTIKKQSWNICMYQVCYEAGHVAPPPSATMATVAGGRRVAGSSTVRRKIMLNKSDMNT